MSDVEPGSFKPFEVTAAHLIYVGLGFFIVIFGMLSLFIKERLYLGEAPIAALFGIIVGPAALNLFNPSGWAGSDERAPGGHVTDQITLEIMRVTIALSVFAVGVELPKKYLLRHWRSIAMLLGPVMLYGWLVTAGFVLLLVPGMDFLNSLVIAACVTPTDPILAQAVVGGPWAEKHVPAHLRHMLQCESGCNDGAAFPFLYLALFLTTHRGDAKTAIAEWFYDALAYQIIFGTLLGALIGWAARKAMRFAERKRWVDRESFVAQYVSLAIASMGVNVLLGSDDLLAAFACGTAFAWDGWFTKQTEDSNFSNIVDLLFNCATFIYIGALMPWYEFAHAADSLNIWRCFVLAIAVLSLKRIPIILALWRWIPDIKTFREAIFSAHFGPMGVGAIFIATLGREELPLEVASPPETPNDVLALTIQPVVFFLVLCSITIHGLTVPFFAFSKSAATLTRTWSRNPSFMDDGGPGWMNRMKRFRTADTMQSGAEVEGGGMTEIQRVLNAQLGVIGKGAIGGEAEKELRGDTSSPSGSGSGSGEDGEDSSSRTRYGLLNTRTDRDLEKAEGDLQEEDSAPSADSPKHETARRGDDVDDLDDWDADEAEDPSCEWGGDDTAEMRIYRAKQQEKREAARRRKEQGPRTSDEGQDGDMGEAPMDRELISGDIAEEDEDEDARLDKEGQAKYGCSDDLDDHHKGSDRQEKEQVEQDHKKEDTYPKARSWLEGNCLLIEYSESRLAEPDVHMVDLSPEEANRIASSHDEESACDSVAHQWLAAHADEIDHHVEDGAHREWHPAETARELVRSGALQSWLSSGSKPKNKPQQPKILKAEDEEEETDDQRRSRADMMYSAMSSHRTEEDEDHPPSVVNRNRDLAVNTTDYFAKRQDGDDDAVDSASGSSLASPAPSPRHASPGSPSRSTSRHKSPPAAVRRGSASVAGGSSRPPHPRQHLATGRRNSMRKKVLSGKIGLGQISHDAQLDEDDLEEDEPDRPSRSDSIHPIPASGTASPSSGLLRSRASVERQRNSGIKDRTPSASVSFMKMDDKKHDRIPRDMASSASQRSSSASLQQQPGAGSTGGSSSPGFPLTRTISLGDDDSTTGGSSSKGRRGGKRLSGFLSALTGGTSSSGSSRQPTTFQEEESLRPIPSREQPSEQPQMEEKGESQSLSWFTDFSSPKSTRPSSAQQQQGGPSSSPTSTPAASGHRSGSATPGPITRTHHEGVVGEGILTNSPAGGSTPARAGGSTTPVDQEGGGNGPSVAFDL